MASGMARIEIREIHDAHGSGEIPEDWPSGLWFRALSAAGEVFCREDVAACV
jgi:hypothetical protein